jgi:hypothetical protein
MYIVLYTKILNYSTEESELMRLFFNISEESIIKSTNSTVISSNILNSSISDILNSVVVNSNCYSIQANNAVIVNCTAKSIIAKEGAILYNIITDGDIVINENEVLVGLYSESSDLNLPSSISSNLNIDGGVYWDKLALSNTLTFENIFDINSSANCINIENLMIARKDENFEKIKSKLV